MLKWRKTKLRAKHVGVWFARFRHRKGYGVHSPFAFGFITQTIYKPLPKETKRALRQLRREIRATAQKELPLERAEGGKLRRLLYNMVYRFRPDTVHIVGTATPYTLLYIAHARPEARIISINTEKELYLPDEEQVQLLYINAADDAAFVRKAFNTLADRTTPQSAFVISGIHGSKEMKQLWREMAGDSRSGITFDLYDAGIVLFDKKIIKQDYIVNF